MAVPKANNAQRDFSGGEADSWIKRADDMPQHKTVARQASNWRPLSSRGLANRPGRRIIGQEHARVDEVIMSPGNNFYLVFGATYLRVYNSSFTIVFDAFPVTFPWTNATVKNIVWDVYKLSVYITFDGMQPQVLTWDGVSRTSSWTCIPYAETLRSSGQKRTAFYRISPLGITINPSVPVGGSVNFLGLTNAGAGFTQVPTVTIGNPSAGGTTATATCSLNARGAAVTSGGSIATDPNGFYLFLPDGVVAVVTATSRNADGTYAVTDVLLFAQGNLAAGLVPANPVAVLAISASSMIVAPTISLVWQIATLTLTNAGGSGYVTIPSVTFSPNSSAVAVATISAVGTLNTTLTFSSGILTNAHVGTRVRYINRQILITGVTSPTTGTGIIEEQLFSQAQFSTAAHTNLNTIFAIGDELIGQTSGAKAVVSDISVSGTDLRVQYIGGTQYSIPETLVGPSGAVLIDVTLATNLNPGVTTIWDEEVMNPLRGYPRACVIDQSRLVFCDFPAVPGLIVWSAVGDFTDLYTDENNVAATNAIQELAPGKSRVYYVVPGAEGSEFVFCDNALYYVPINQANPLKPGSVAFNVLLSEGIAQIQPRPVQQSIVFVSAGGTQIKAVQAIGAYSRPYIIDDISELHSHLLHAPIAIAAPGGSDQFEESYFYLCNSDGSLVLCSFDIANGVIDKKSIGWLPWTGAGTATWISALKGHSDVIVTGSYAPNGNTQFVVEIVDASQYLDAAMPYNSVPGNLTPPGGKGPLYWLANGAVDVMDGLRMMGTYQIDGNGFLVPQNNAGENFTSLTLNVGQAWTATLEPFVPAVQPGQDVQQRLRKRRVSRFEVYVQNSTGFTMCRLFGGPVTRTSPAVGTVMQRRRIEAWNQDDDPTVAPPLREQSYSERPTGRFHDPRVAIIKDTPGPLTIMEVDLEVTV